MSTKYTYTVPRTNNVIVKHERSCISHLIIRITRKWLEKIFVEQYKSLMIIYPRVPDLLQCQTYLVIDSGPFE